MVAYGDFKLRVLRVLDDLDRGNPSWTDDDLLDYAREGLNVLSQHTAETKQVDQVLTANLTTYAYPDDYLAPGPVWLISGIYRYILEPIALEPGQDLPIQITPGKRTRFYEYPAGSLTFLKPLATGDSLRVMYWGYWDPPESDSSQLGIFRWMEEALKWDMLARAMAKPGAQAASLGQYKTKRDLGTPDDNPLLEYAKWAQRQYDRTMAEHAPQDRTAWGNA